MVDTSWDNTGAPEASKGMPTWAKVLLGCGGGCVLIFIVLIASCVAIGHKIKQDPKGFENRIKGWVQNWAKEDWARLRSVEAELRTIEGSQSLYRNHPDLHDAFGNEEAFLRAAATWRPLLAPVPPDIPDLDTHHVKYNRMGRRTVIGYRNEKGHTLTCTFEGPRLLRIEVKPSPMGKPDSQEE